MQLGCTPSVQYKSHTCYRSSTRLCGRNRATLTCRCGEKCVGCLHTFYEGVHDPFSSRSTWSHVVITSNMVTAAVGCSLFNYHNGVRLFSVICYRKPKISLNAWKRILWLTTWKTGNYWHFLSVEMISADHARYQANQSANQPINQSISQSVYQSISWSGNQSVNN